jgi:hypothetical protein
VSLANLKADEGLRIDGADPGELSGVAVSSAGDLNEDGLDDVLVGAPGGNGPNPTGAGYVVFGDLFYNGDEGMAAADAMSAAAVADSTDPSPADDFMT